MTKVLSKRNGNLFPTLWTDFPEDFFSPRFPDWNLANWDVAAKIPSVNISERDTDFLVELAAPGLSKKDFKVELDDHMLTIAAEKREEKKESKGKYSRREFSYESFSRSFMLPDNCKTDKVEAKYEDGILKIELPKKEVATAKGKKEIAVG